MSPFLLLKFLILLHFFQSSQCFTFNMTVSKDGTGNFTRVSDAIAAAPTSSSTRFYIHVKSGIYEEHVEVPREKTFISLIGDSASNTVIVDDRNIHNGYTTATSATFTVNGNKFMAQYITFENSAGPIGQAVAFLDRANYTTYYKCVFQGYQDTLFTTGAFQFFKECVIYGSIDFIFGDGLVVFQDCSIYVRLWRSMMTAQSKSNANERSGFVFQNCNITASPGSIKDNVSVWLGRPWRNRSTVIVMQSFMDTIVEPSGWSPWEGSKTPLNLLFYAEYKNYGPGADTSKRVNWHGYHVLHTEDEASKFTVDNFIDGQRWLLESKVPFRGGLHA